MNILKIDDNDRQLIQEVIEFAEANEYTLDDMLDRMNDPDLTPGLDERHNCLLSVGVRAVFSIEQQPSFKARHLSVTLNEDTPPIDMVTLLMEEFGFEGGLMDCAVWKEPIGQGQEAINVLEPIR